MGDRRRMMALRREKVLFTKRFYPAGTYTWTVPAGCTSVDVFLVGAGGGSNVNNGASYGGGGGGYTKTYRGTGYVAPSSGTWVGTSTEGRDGNAVSVTPGQSIEIIVGAGVAAGAGGYSQFMNSSYRALGGKAGGSSNRGGDGGSGGSGCNHNDSVDRGGSDGSDGYPSSSSDKGKGQGHTTRDFGEPSGKRNAGGGGRYSSGKSGASDYTAGTGYDSHRYTYRPSNNMYGGYPGGGYGGGAGAPVAEGTTSGTTGTIPVPGGDGTVLIRYYAYE